MTGTVEHNWTPGRVEFMTAMLAAGRSPFEAATRLGGISEATVIDKARELNICVPVIITDHTMDRLIDELVQEIDYDAWKLGYNEDTAEEPEFVENNRSVLKAIIFRNGA